MAKGFSQIPRVDYFATYVSVVRYKSLQMNLAVGMVLNYELWQIDYTSTYLNIPVQVPTLMEQPEGYKVKPSDVYEVDIMVSKWVQGSIEGGSGGKRRDNEKRSLVSLVDKALYKMMDAARN